MTSADGDGLEGAGGGDAGAGADEPRTPRSAWPGVIVLAAGLVVALWIAFGRFLFGIGGSMTVWYVLLAIAVLILQAFAARAIILTAKNGYRSRAWTFIIIAFSWAFGLLNGATLPDSVDGVTRTIVSGADSTGVQFAIGVTNPAAIICLSLSGAAIFLGYYDARGRKPKYDEDAILDERDRLGLPDAWPANWAQISAEAAGVIPERGIRQAAEAGDRQGSDDSRPTTPDTRDDRDR